MDWWDNSEKEIARILREVHDAEAEESKPLTPEEFTSSIVQPAKTPTRQTRSSDNGGRKQTPVKPVEVAPEPKADDEVVLRGVVQNVVAEKKPVEVYRAARLLSHNMSPDDFITPTYRHRNDVAQKVMTVLNIEGPISESLMTRRVVQSYSIARAGSRIQQFMSSVYKSMNLKTTTQGGERFFWKPTQNPHSYTEFRANGDGDCKRDAKEIPIQEAANAVYRALEEQFSLPQEDLIRAAANLMGINRIGSAVNALFLGGITWAEKEGKISRSSNGNWMIKE